MVPTCDKQTSCRTTPKDSSSEPAASSWELPNHTDVQNIGSELQLLQVLKLENGWESLKKRRTLFVNLAPDLLYLMEFPGALARFWHALGLKNAIWSGLTHVLHMKWWWQMDVLEVVSLGSKKALAWFGTMGRPSEIVVNQEYVHAGRRRILRIWTSVAQGNGTGFENVILSSGPICWIPLDSIGFYWILVSTTRCSTAIIDCAGCTATLTRGRSAKGLPGNGTKWAWSLLPCEDRNREETENPGPDSASFRSRVWGWDWFHAFNLGSFFIFKPLPKSYDSIRCVQLCSRHTSKHQHNA